MYYNLNLFSEFIHINSTEENSQPWVMVSLYDLPSYDDRSLLVQCQNIEITVSTFPFPNITREYFAGR